MYFHVGLHQPSDCQHFERSFVSINRVRNRKSPFAVRKWIMDSGAEAISRMDGQEIVMAAQQVGQTVKSLALVHGWQQNVTTTLRLDVLASGSSDSAPVIDV